VAIAAGALSVGLEAASGQTRSEMGTAPDEAAQLATPKPRLIPEAGSLARPKSLEQVGVPTEVTRQAIPPDNPQTPEKVALGQNCKAPGSPEFRARWCGEPHNTSEPFGLSWFWPGFSPYLIIARVMLRAEPEHPTLSWVESLLRIALGDPRAQSILTAFRPSAALHGEVIA
jgi:hypothetical protein